jgi:hypothetical protein
LTRLKITIVSPFVIIVLALLPLVNSGKSSTIFLPAFQKIIVAVINDPADVEVSLLYDSLQLEKFGLKKEAFIYAYTGYKNLTEKGVFNKEGIITICDFSQSSKNKRLYLIDLNNYKLLLNTYVAHGRNSGGEFAKKFSNKPQSLQSSLGFYKTKETYFGSHGLALTIAGLEKGINDKAERRKIVVHGSDYIGDNYLRFSKYMGRSFGCPAIPKKYTNQLINTIKNGSCLFIYHPDKYYLAGSKILNG